MKVLIVDDERHVRNSVRKLMNWDQVGITTILEAESGSAAKELIVSEKPELVITDIMMPDLTGIQLLEWLETHQIHCKKIVISGYNDFELVRNVVRYGGTDYILKPIVPSQLQNAVCDAIQEWTKEEQERQAFMQKSIEVNELKPLYQDRLLSKFIEHPMQKASLLRDLPQLARVTQCRIGVTQLDLIGDRMMSKFAADPDLFFFAITNIFNEYFIRENSGIAFRNWNQHSEIVFLIWGESLLAERLLTEALEAVTCVYHLNLFIGLGHTVVFPDQVRDSYAQGKKAYLQRNLLHQSTRVIPFQADYPYRTTTLRFSEYADKMWTSIKTKNPEKIREAVQEWFHTLSKLESISLEQFKLWREELHVTVTHWLADADNPQNVQPDFPLPFDESGNFSLPMLQEALVDRFILLSHAISPNAQRSTAMQEIALYLQNNYDREISLQDISSRFYLHRDYISRRFKQEFNETIISYISKLRLDRAKKLLIQADLPISEIAQSVGYDDEKYFSRVFKKYVGMSPKEFRDQR